MAVFDGTQNYTMTTEQAALYTRMELTSGEAVDQNKTSRALISFLLGNKTVQGKKVFDGKNGKKLAVDKLGFENAHEITGFRNELVVEVGSSTGAALTIANSTSAHTVKTVDTIRTFEFPNSFYKDDISISNLFKLFANSRRVSPDAVKARINTMAKGYWDYYEAMCWNTSAVAPSESVIASMEYLLSDQLSAANRAIYWTALGVADNATGTPDESAFGDYMVTRSATGNEWARSVIRRPGTSINTTQIKQYVRQLVGNGAMRDNLCVWLPPSFFDQIATEVANPANTGIRTDYMADKIQRFGLKDYVIVDNDILVTYDPRMPSNRGYILDRSTWHPGFSVLDSETAEALHLNYASKTSFVAGHSLLCNAPRQNAKLYLL